jgi:hypothetical protein
MDGYLQRTNMELVEQFCQHIHQVQRALADNRVVVILLQVQLEAVYLSLQQRLEQAAFAL